MLIIDGAIGEGGGSIIRFSMAFAALLKQPVKILNIRANRSKPGLRAQHLTGIQIIHQISGGNLLGASLASTEIEFNPDKKLKQTSIHAKVVTAGSLGLIFQALQLAFCQTPTPVTVDISGGATYGAWSPSLDYIKKITNPALQAVGFKSEITIHRHGFYPKGGAKVRFKFLPPDRQKVLNFAEQSELHEIHGISIASKHLEKAKVAERMKTSTKKVFNKIMPKVNINIETKYVDSISAGCGLTLWAESFIPFGKTIVGKRGLSSEQIGKTIANNFITDWSNHGAIDVHLTDQLIPTLGMLPTSTVLTGPLSSHTKTNIEIVEKFLPIKFEIVSPEKNKFFLIRSKQVT